MSTSSSLPVQKHDSSSPSPGPPISSAMKLSDKEDVDLEQCHFKGPQMSYWRVHEGLGTGVRQLTMWIANAVDIGMSQKQPSRSCKIHQIQPFPRHLQQIFTTPTTQVRHEQFEDDDWAYLALTMRDKVFKRDATASAYQQNRVSSSSSSTFRIASQSGRHFTSTISNVVELCPAHFCGMSCYLFSLYPLPLPTRTASQS
ncbi:hypothetical protein C8J56DRAFT_1102232 [Mycena floridula]|nr:hypothetical protein C8J56DRAFT_1102232 [Mycena floridula]